MAVERAEVLSVAEREPCELGKRAVAAIGAFGTVPPQPPTLARLLGSAFAGELPHVAPDPDVDALVRHLNANRLRA